MATKYPIALALSVIFLFAACKKQEEDPKVSLRTRKARVTEKWHMISGKTAITRAGYNETYTFDGSNVKLNVTSPNNPVVYTGRYTLDLEIDKSGTFSFEEYLAGEKLHASGTWNFGKGVGEEKNKESLVFAINDVSSGYTFGYNLFNRYCANFEYKIEVLRHKRLVISSGGKIYSDSKASYITLSNEYTFEPQKD